MKKRGYLDLLEPILKEYAKHDYEYWKERIENEPITFQNNTSDGRVYQVEILSFWDNASNGHIRIVFSIDDGGWRAWVPVTQTLLLSPDGSYE